MQDDLGDRMKAYERVETDRKFDRSTPLYVRLDGRGFSRFTHGMNRPFDSRMSATMIAATADIIMRTKACVGYAQSDEVSLVFENTGETSEMMFAGKSQKITSVFAAMFTALFNQHLSANDLAEYWSRLPHFDCRAFSLPSREEAANALLWREKDAYRNAIQMVAQANFSHRELQGVKTSGLIDMLSARGITMDQFPDFFRYGTFVQNRTVDRPITEAELMSIPECHRPVPDSIVRRHAIKTWNQTSVLPIADRVNQFFNGADPE